MGRSRCSKVKNANSPGSAAERKPVDQSLLDSVDRSGCLYEHWRTRPAMTPIPRVDLRLLPQRVCQHDLDIPGAHQTVLWRLLANTGGDLLLPNQSDRIVIVVEHLER